MASHKDRMLRGEPYLPDDAELVAERQRCLLLTERFNATSVAEPRAREAILRCLLGQLGEATQVIPPFHFDYGYQIKIGARTLINAGAVILDSAAVRIGDEVQLGPGVQLVTATHPLQAAARRNRYETAAPIRIDDGAWLAAGVIVCGGVSIGSETVVGAGSVVTRDLPPRHLCFGNPCRVVRDLSVEQ